MHIWYKFYIEMDHTQVEEQQWRTDIPYTFERQNMILPMYHSIPEI